MLNNKKEMIEAIRNEISIAIMKRLILKSKSEIINLYNKMLPYSNKEP